ncbi:MAG: IS200/IS605 family transposase, partial [Duncaniella sp.]|nr:IS200/IS605 family transposase [Duncaniella sp.]
PIQHRMPRKWTPNTRIDVPKGHQEIDSRMHPSLQGSGCIRKHKISIEMSERHPRNIHTNLLMSYIRHYFHIVFSPKYRQPLISEKIEKTVYHLIYNQIMKYHGYVHRINGMPDHIHILASFPPKFPHSEVIKVIKQETSKNIKSLGIIPSWNGWEEGYASFTCSFREIETIKKYIINQKIHHSSIGFADEYRAWLIDNGIHEDNPYM